MWNVTPLRHIQELFVHSLPGQTLDVVNRSLSYFMMLGVLGNDLWLVVLTKCIEVVDV